MSGNRSLGGSSEGGASGTEVVAGVVAVGWTGGLPGSGGALAHDRSRAHRPGIVLFIVQSVSIASVLPRYLPAGTPPPASIHRMIWLYNRSASAGRGPFTSRSSSGSLPR